MIYNLYPVKDTTIYSDKVNYNSGNDTQLMMYNSKDGYSRALIKFDYESIY